MVSVWVSLVVRSAVIMGGAELLRRCVPKSASAQRHRFLLAAFAMLMLWPMLAAILPELSIPVWMDSAKDESVTIQQRVISLGPIRPANHGSWWAIAVWMGGVLLALAPAILGYSKVVRFARKAVPLVDVSWTDLLARLCTELRIKTQPDLLMCKGSITPLTFGLWRARILLPAECLQWTGERRRAVLLHELAHVKRRDIHTQLFASVVAALWWFQPLCWISRASLRAESERACDRVVLAAGIRASEYAAELLEIAQSCGNSVQWSSAAIAMVRRGELEERLRSILTVEPQAIARRFSIAVVAILALVTAAASAITVTPKQSKNPRGGLNMRRTVLSGLLAATGISAATIGGTLFDPSGAAISNAKVVVIDPDNLTKQETTTSAQGRFSFQDLPAAQYILRVEKPGFAALLREFNVQNDSSVERGLVLNPGPVAEKSDTRVASPDPSNPQLLRVKGEFEQENLIKKVNPVYPAGAKAAGAQGVVLLETTVSKDGVPTDIRVISSPREDLSEASLEAVRQWRYRPVLLNGQATDVVTEVRINFTLAR